MFPVKKECQRIMRFDLHLASTSNDLLRNLFFVEIPTKVIYWVHIFFVLHPLRLTHALCDLEHSNHMQLLQTGQRF